MFRRSKKWARLIALVWGFMMLVTGGRFYSLGDPLSQQIGLFFFGVALHALITAVVYVSDWFERLDYSMRIFTLTWVAPAVGTIAGYIMDNLRGATFGMGIAVVAADSIAVSFSIYMYLRDEKESHDYEEAMKKYGKEP